MKAKYRYIRILVKKNILKEPQAHLFLARFNHPEAHPRDVASRYFGYQAEAQKTDINISSVIITIMVALIGSVVTATTSHSTTTKTVLIIAYLLSLGLMVLTYVNSRRAYMAALRKWATQEAEDHHLDTGPAQRSHSEWYVRGMAKFYHTLDPAIRNGIKELLGKPGPKERPKLPITQIFIVVTIIIAGLVISYNAPRHVGSAFWIGGLSLNTIVAGGFLAFAPWLQDRAPDIMIAMVREAVDAGLAKWGDGLTPETARDLFHTLTVSKRVWVSIGMTAAGLIMLTLNLVAFALMAWLPQGTRVGVTTVLIALMVDVVINVALGLSVLRAWPAVWKVYDSFRDEHNKFNPCPLCGSQEDSSHDDGILIIQGPEPLTLPQ